ncbi:DoxX family protein [Brevundimonas sp.]|uniref:DoxX family protein n=1 Tax=Brevundimonas sp. TaxID=1871086 RepID=UPI0035632057
MSAIFAPPTPCTGLCAHKHNLMLWTLQGWIAMFFIAAGYAKLTEPLDMLVILLGWPAHASLALVQGLGVAEVVLAVMLLAPLISWRLGRPLLLVAAAALAVLEMVMLLVHLLGQDWSHVAVNLNLLALTAFVFWSRARERR